MQINNALHQFYIKRKQAIHDGLETKELAGLLMEKFSEGALSVTEKDNTLRVICDDYCDLLDPNHKQNRQKRYQVVADLDLSKPRTFKQVKNLE